MTVRIGIVLPTRGILITKGPDADFRQILTQAQKAESLGIDGVWVGDSLVAKPRLEPLAALSAVAGVTEKVRLGTSVLLAALRPPVLLAQTAATVDLLSNGRLTLGIGVGGVFNPAQQQEWKAAGVDSKGRGTRTAEIVEIMRLLWSGEPITFHGRHFDLEDVSLGYRTRQSPGARILLACHSGEGLQAQYRRAARLGDGLMSITDSPEQFATVRETVLGERAALGLLPEGFGATYYMTVNINQDSEAAFKEADAWVRGYYGLNYWQDRWGPYGTAQAIAERANRYIDAGADELVFRFAATDQASQLDAFYNEVLPALRR